ncbi:MAG: sensor histidine kinase [Rhodocyclales bacterium GT-UBC]|nr:MAG: sensor histidine kinase [Rhodocyclales bacterium GT-UBC]
MKRYPRSFLQLVTLGHILVALPLLVADAYVFVALDSLNSRYRAAVEQESTSSRLSGELTEDLVHMERDLRRYEVLMDAQSLSDYAQVRSEWQMNLQAFSRLPPLPERLVAELNDQLALERKAYLSLRETGDATPLHEAIDDIKGRSQNALDEARNILEREQELYMADSERLRIRLVVAAAGAALVTLCCLWLIRRLLSRLIGRFEKAVLRLGKGDLKQEIALDGTGDLRWLGRWLEWLRRRLLSLEENRTQVLRHVSHELKTPLAAMHEGASLLNELIAGPLTPEQRRIVGILQSNSRRLQDLIEGLLRLQQAGHAAERIGHEKLRFDQLITEVIETYRLSAGERQLHFDCAMQETEIIAGREGVMTIINNLLSNAVKFSPDCSSIGIRLTHDSDQAIFEVIDHGPGIDAKDSEKIFEPFYRGNAPRKIAGVGLGLAIAREFVIAHRGSLHMEPTAEGAHFKVILPLHAPYLRHAPNT